MNMPSSRSAMFLLPLLLLAACHGPPPPPPPPPTVGVITVAPTSVRNFVELPGRVEAVRTAEVRARVDGIVQHRVYIEGSDVAAGQTLFRIDPREKRADYEASLATLQRNRATEINAAQVVARYKPLISAQAISKQEYDSAIAQERTGLADVANARAQADHARLSLSYTNVTAPISGRVGRAEVTEGALVSASAATLLTKVEQLDPVFVNFSQSSRDILEIRRKLMSGQIKVGNLRNVLVSLTLEDGTPFGVKGHLNFADMSVDQSTGTVSLRAEFPNHVRLLLPGQFVRARIEAGVNPDGIKVPQRAVVIDDKGAAMVMMLSPDSKAVPRPVNLGQLDGSQWVVVGGLTPGDRVIVDGLLLARPGSPVRVARPGETVPPPPPRHETPDQSSKH